MQACDKRHHTLLAPNLLPLLASCIYYTAEACPCVCSLLPPPKRSQAHSVRLQALYTARALTATRLAYEGKQQPQAHIASVYVPQLAQEHLQACQAFLLSTPACACLTCECPLCSNIQKQQQVAAPSARGSVGG